ncbi:MAG: hypothetical protein H7070_03695 [Saprospiraceae bacterium]|nr:hypothetical protein [Pyrinomonadaceae bacterium]
MARKKRTVTPAILPAADQKEKVAYRGDQFQQKVGKTIEGAGKKLEGQGRNILYAIAALVVLAIVIWIVMSWSGRSNSAGQAALGKAIETSQAQVTDSPPPAGSTAKTFKTEKERADASIAEFQAVADKFGGDIGEKAKYFVAVNRLGIDRPAAVQELEALAKSNDEVGKLSKFALAEAKANGGDMDGAVVLYQELAAMPDAIVAKDTINFELAKIYEKQGKKQEAVDLLFNIAKTASEAKDLEGKAITLTPTAQSAKEKLKQLDPEKAKEIPEPAPDQSLGGMPFGM